MYFLIYGDGAVGAFEGVESTHIILKRKRGYSIEQLVKEQGSMTARISNDLKLYTTEEKKLIFVLGQIDVLYNYYETTAVNHLQYDFRPIIREFVQFLSQLSVPNKDIIVFAVIPNNAGTQEFIQKLSNKFKIKPSNDMKYQQINKRRVAFNQYLKTQCVSNNIVFINCDKQLLNKSKFVHKKYLNPNRYSLHIIREYQLEVMAVYLQKYGFPPFKASVIQQSKYNQPKNKHTKYSKKIKYRAKKNQTNKFNS